MTLTINSSIELDEKQREAVNLCCDLSHKNRLVAVTGAAGTGKTTIMRHVYSALVQAGYTVALVAPTGKAAKRIREATSIEAKTIHRLLEYSYPGEPDPETGIRAETSGPRRDPRNPLTQDVIICDEAAMVNTSVYRNLVDALKPGSAIRFFGDVNQLEPIEENGFKGKSPFQTLLDASHVQSVRLDTIHRQGEGSSIIRNGQNILRGMAPMSYPDFAVKINAQPIIRLGEICRELCLADKPTFNSVSNQIITPARSSTVGSVALNKVLADIYDPGGEAIRLERHPWEITKFKQKELVLKVGHKVICNTNMYDLRQTEESKLEGDRWIAPEPHQSIFNGETGIVTGIEGGYVAIDVGDRVVTIPPWIEKQSKKGGWYTFDPRKEIELAYAITTHKAQGSEFENVLYFISSSGQFNQCRANFYTGITRAKKIVLVLADERSFRFFSLRKETPSWNK